MLCFRFVFDIFMVSRASLFSPSALHLLFDSLSVCIATNFCLLTLHARLHLYLHLYHKLCQSPIMQISAVRFLFILKLRLNFILFARIAALRWLLQDKYFTHLTMYPTQTYYTSYHESYT